MPGRFLFVLSVIAGVGIFAFGYAMTLSTIDRELGKAFARNVK